MTKTVLVLVALCACGSDDGGSSAPDASTGGGCGACVGETICIANRCEAAFPRAYNVTNVRIAVPTKTPTGADWDAGGGAPDMILTILVNGAPGAPTAAAPDAFAATYAGPFTVQLTAGARLDLTITDEDIAADDPVFTCSANPITAENLRARAIGCGTAPRTLDYVITPK